MGGVVKAVENVTKEVTKGVENVVKETSKGVENITRETGKGLEVVGVTTANVGNLVGGDVGKVINAVTAPVGGQVAAVGSAVKGDWNGAMTRATGSVVAGITAPLSASSTLKEVANHDTVNFLTLGQSRDLAKSDDISRKFINTGEHSAEDWSTLTRTTARATIVAGAVMGGSAFAATETGKGFMGAVGAKTAAGAGTAAAGAATGAINNAINGNKSTETTTAPTAQQSSSGALLAVAAAGAALVFGLII